jgi:hypothetical protein
MRDLGPGDASRALRVRACVRWNATGVRVMPGQRYAFVASGRWTDFFISAGPDGYAAEAHRFVGPLLRRFENQRRAPDELWFCLMGSVEPNGTPFRIGSRLEWTVPQGVSGEIGCFANDVPFAYLNNWGAVQLTIERRA